MLRHLNTLLLGGLLCTSGLAIENTVGNAFYGVNACENTNYSSGDDTCIGWGAGLETTSGFGNTYLGTLSGSSNTNGDENTYVGNSSGENSTASYNTFAGSHSGHMTTSGALNTFIGGKCGYGNLTGERNTYIGYASGHNGQSGHRNAFFGFESGFNATGINNVLMGYQAGYGASGNHNVMIGYESGLAEGTGAQNTFVGYQSGRLNTSGEQNTFIGSRSGSRNTSGGYNTFIGRESGTMNTFGYFNTFSGFQSGSANDNGGHNAFYGYQSGFAVTSGIGNVFVGSTTGHDADISNSVLIGFGAGYHAQRDNVLYVDNTGTEEPLIYGQFDTDTLTVHGRMGIGTKTPGAMLDVLGTIEATYEGVTTSGNGLKNLLVLSNKNTDNGYISDVGFSLYNARERFEWFFRTAEAYQEGFMVTKAGTGGAEMVLRNSSDHFANVVLELGNGAWCNGTWHNASSRDLKQDIRSLDEVSAQNALDSLEPVTYAYKAHPEDPMVGFIAEDVPELVADPGRKSISTIDIVAVLTRVVKAQKQQIKAQDAAMKAAYGRERALEARIERLESILTAFETVTETSDTLSCR